MSKNEKNVCWLCDRDPVEDCYFCENLANEFSYDEYIDTPIEKIKMFGACTEFLDEMKTYKRASIGKIHMNEQGTRDSKGKPPRHYFYEGLHEVLNLQQSKTLLEMVESVIDSLAANTAGSLLRARLHINKAITNLELGYGDALLADVSYICEMGAKKYGHNNYKKGMNFSLCISSFMGHMIRYDRGEENDFESGRSHMLHMAANMLILLGYLSNGDYVERFNDIPKMFDGPKK